MKSKLLLFLSVFFVACNDTVQPAEKATLTNVEVGLNNNEIGVINKDFHFNAEILAATKLESVTLKIVAREEETYTKPWSFEKSLPQYKDVKNAQIHEHFNIPSDAAEGKYDFVILVKDQNGTILEEKRTIRLYLTENLPVNPQLFSLYVGVVNQDYKFLREVYNSFTPEKTDLHLKREDLLTVRAAISGVKDNGKAVVVLINKKHRHRPESLEAIDYSKVIIVDVAQHNGIAASGSFSTTTDRSTTPATLRKPVLKIGADTDNNIPAGNPVNGLKSWEPGGYYLGLIYTNTTHNIGYFEYIEVQID